MGEKPETFVCNGAFKLAEYQIGSHILMVKNDAYYEADKVKLPGIRAIMVNDENTSLQGYKAGEIHCTEIIPAEEVPSLLAEDPNLIVSPICGTKYLDFNVDRPVIDDVRVRRALTLALNRKEITDQITRSGEIPATGFLPPTTEKTDGTSYRTMGPTACLSLLMASLRTLPMWRPHRSCWQRPVIRTVKASRRLNCFTTPARATRRSARQSSRCGRTT